MPSSPPHRAAYLDGALLDHPDPAALEAALHAEEGLVWLDVHGPSPEDEAVLQEAFGLHPLALEDAAKAGQRAKIEQHDAYYFIIMYAPVPTDDALDLRPLHLFVGARFLVTVHAQPIPQVDETLRRWQAPGSPLESRSGAVLYALLDAIVDDYFPALDAIADAIDALEDAIFEPGAESVVATVFQLKKELLRLRRRIAPERDVLNVLMRRALPVCVPADMPYLQDVYDHLIRLAENIDLYRDLLASALDSHLSFQSNRLNQIVKVLTVASIVLMTNALVAGIYGMNFTRMPELEWAYGYPFALGLMATLTAALIVFFRRRRWV